MHQSGMTKHMATNKASTVIFLTTRATTKVVLTLFAYNPPKRPGDRFIFYTIHIWGFRFPLFTTIRRQNTTASMLCDMYLNGP